MNFNFELILFYATLVTGVIALLDLIARKIFKRQLRPLIVVEYAVSFFPVLILVFMLRSFLYEPFRIPSGSLEPTLMTGDFIVVNKFDYGLRLPVLHKKIFGSGEPQRGDIMVFRWPPNPSINFIKRVIGLPGDRISYVNKELTVNGKKVPQTFIKNSEVAGEGGDNWTAQEKTEDLLGIKHHIYIDSAKTGKDYKDIVVPEGMYFVMGDNRDDSADSRYWGFVPESNIVGKAVMVWISWDNNKDGMIWNRIRWNRFGDQVK